MNPYFLMVILYLSLAVLSALEASFSSLHILPWFNGMKWLRIHLITLGALTETFFWLLPVVTAVRAKLPRPSFRWDIWLTLNAGILLLLIGIPLVNAVPIFAGGALVFTAVVLLIAQLSGLRPEKTTSPVNAGRKFYLAGLSYFLLGILIGTGLWFGWNEALGNKSPLEAHIHANNWGLMSLVFAGLLVDFYPKWAKRPLANPRSITPIFWLMSIGAFGLVFGPWLGATYLLVPGLILHLVATGWLLFNVIQPLRGDRAGWTTGMLHLVTSYFWLLAPVLVAPLVLLHVPGIPGPTIEANAPQALIYGWVLQFGFAIVPYFFQRVFLPDEQPILGGSRFSLAAVHVGGLLLWSSIFAAPAWKGPLFGLAYLLWTASMLPIVRDLWQMVAAGTKV
ncbi:MAG: hypothetical protein P8183_09180 [Anaerolineae bacterium]